LLTGHGLFAIWGGDFEQIFQPIFSMKVKTISNSNLVQSIKACGKGKGFTSD